MGAVKDKGRQLHQIERVPYEDAFLIGDLLTTRTTVLSGEPKAGKTLLSAGMGIALLNGEPTFLGQPVLRKLDHIVFGVTDDGAPEELKERLHGAVADDAVTVFPVEDPGDRDPSYWAGIGADLAELRPGLFVLDNIIGALAPGEDIASSVTAQRIMRSLRPISEAGIPTLLVTHTPIPSYSLAVLRPPIRERLSLCQCLIPQGNEFRSSRFGKRLPIHDGPRIVITHHDSRGLIKEPEIRSEFKRVRPAGNIENVELLATRSVRPISPTQLEPQIRRERTGQHVHPIDALALSRVGPQLCNPSLVVIVWHRLP